MKVRSFFFMVTTSLKRLQLVIFFGVNVDSLYSKAFLIPFFYKGFSPFWVPPPLFKILVYSPRCPVSMANRMMVPQLIC